MLHLISIIAMIQQTMDKLGAVSAIQSDHGHCSRSSDLLFWTVVCCNLELLQSVFTVIQYLDTLFKFYS